MHAMRVAFVALAGMAGAAWLSVHAAAVPISVPPTRDIPVHSPIAEGCGYGWHWTGGYTAASGAWVTGRCQIDR
jgi:hypothetical protein